MKAKDLKRYSYLIVAHVSVFLAFLGIFLPLLPTTPFLLLAASLYMKSSKRMHSWLLNHPLFGKIIYDYMIHRSVRLKHKFIAWTMLWAGLGFSMWWLSSAWLRLALFIIGVAVSVHIYLLKTRPSPAHDQQSSRVNLLSKK